MRRLWVIMALTALCSAGSFFAAIWWIDPVQQADEAQRAILDEYRAIYCVKDTTHNAWFMAGQAALMSRLLVKADLGHLALEEFGKCQIWVR